MRDEELIYGHIRKRIRELRRSHPKTEQKTTQEQLAVACGVERSTLTNIELGNQRPPIFVIYRVCVYFGIALNDVLPDLESIYAEESTTVKFGDTEHPVGGETTVALIESLRSTRT